MGMAILFGSFIFRRDAYPLFSHDMQVATLLSVDRRSQSTRVTSNPIPPWLVRTDLISEMAPWLQMISLDYKVLYFNLKLGEEMLSLIHI